MAPLAQIGRCCKERSADRKQQSFPLVLKPLPSTLRPNYSSEVLIPTSWLSRMRLQLENVLRFGVINKI